MSRVLIVTNDFPPRPGGIQSFVHGLASRLPGVVVYASSWRGSAEFDARQPYPVIRHPSSVMLPTPAVARRAAALVAAYGVDTVVFGAAAPLGLLAPRLRAAGVRRVVMLTHGHEASWAAVPGFRSVLRRIAASADVVTYLGDYTRARLLRAVPAAKLVRLAPGVDPARFRPSPAAASAVRARLGLGDRPVAVCVSRLVPRKGQDQLIRAWPYVLRALPDAVLLLAGGGPYRRRLERLAASLSLTTSTGWPTPTQPPTPAHPTPVRRPPTSAPPITTGQPTTSAPPVPAGQPPAAVQPFPSGQPITPLSPTCAPADIHFTGTIPAEDLASLYAAADVFAMPCRTRWRGIDVEGLGIVFLEASAAALPVIAGASGGAPDAVRHGETGLIVDGESLPDLTTALIDLLSDQDRSRKMGILGREWITQEWSWDQVVTRFDSILRLP
ncbi:glycosyltransferase [Nonomuraea sp. NPDC050310]|uniref:glycosyltransferase family 4 protein n=1 Tax=Nonomuraea sp. NPDC050310 TaxID=3154935 RepID=UPI0033D3EC05